MRFSQIICLTALAAAAPAQMIGAEYTTPFSLETYTLESLSNVAESGVSKIEPGIYLMANDVTVTKRNSFSIAGVKELRIADGVCLTLECKPDLNSAERVKITRASDDDAPKGIKIDYSSTSATATNIKVANIDFEYASLRNLGTVGMDVDQCTFSFANGALNSAAALSTGPSGASYNITNCEFNQCEVPAIAGSANYYCGLNIKGCKFFDNNTANTNKPQVNLTVGGNLPVVIEDCVFIGEGRNLVGGIGVANLAAGAGENMVIIRNCEVRNHRYGITGTGPMHIEVHDCTIVDNNHETNAMNGGSGINFSGYYYGLDGVISGCHIENSLWGVTLVGCRNVSLGEVGNPSSPGNNVFVNNGNGGVPYDLYNNGTTDVMAQNNTWSVSEQTEENIETVIFHKKDDSKLGLVTFMPANTSAGLTDALVSNNPLYFDGSTIHSEAAAIDVFSITGQKIGSSATHAFDASNLSPGIYIARSGNHAIKFNKH